MLAIVWHSRTGASEGLAMAAAHGAMAAAPGYPVRLVPACEATADLLVQAAGFLFVCPENLGSLSGAMKDMFDRCYYPLLGRVEGRAYATIVSAGSDGRGAQAQLDRIVTGWRLRRVAEPFIVNLGAQAAEAIMAPKILSQSELTRANQLGQALAAGLDAAVF